MARVIDNVTIIIKHWISSLILKVIIKIFLVPPAKAWIFRFQFWILWAFWLASQAMARPVITQCMCWPRWGLENMAFPKNPGLQGLEGPSKLFFPWVGWWLRHLVNAAVAGVEWTVPKDGLMCWTIWSPCSWWRPLPRANALLPKERRSLPGNLASIERSGFDMDVASMPSIDEQLSPGPEKVQSREYMSGLEHVPYSAITRRDHSTHEIYNRVRDDDSGCTMHRHLSNSPAQSCCGLPSSLEHMW